MSGPNSAQLFAAYRAALYTVRQRDGRRFALRVDRRSTELAALMRHFGSASAALITAFNPRSVRLSGAENRRLRRQLVTHIQATGLPALASRAKDPRGEWPAEPGLLVFGLNLMAACKLGQRFCQNAVLYAGADPVPRLVWLGEAAAIKKQSPAQAGL
jgi:hypothetical protein